MEGTGEDLLGFNWEDDGTTEFFETPETKVEETTKKVEEDDDSKGQPKEEIKEEEEIESSFFEEEELDEEGNIITKPTTTSTEDGEYWSNVYKDFREQGILKHVEIEEDEELSSERIFELQQEDYEAEVTARLQHWAKEELDADAQAFISFKKNGGNTADFFKTYSNTTDIPTGELDDEDYQDKVIRYQLAEEGWDADEVEDRIEYLSNNGKKAVVAKKYDAKVRQQAKAQQEAVLEKAKQSKLQAKQKEEDFKTNIKEALEETTEVKGFKITPKDKTDLYGFLTKKNNKISDTQSITGFQKKLGEAFQDTEKMLLLAKLVSSDFDMTQFEKQTITKKTKQIKSNLEQRKNLRPSNSGGSSQGSGLADLF